ncbi:MAG: hypothetical protein R3F60_04730 [bacterium]
MAADGLINLSTAQLEGLVRLIYKGDLPCPISRATLMTMGLNHEATEADLLLGLDRRAALAVLAAVLAERRPRPLKPSWSS